MFTQTKSMTSTVSDFFKNSGKNEYNILDAKDFNKIYLFFNKIYAKLSTIAKPSSEIGKQCNRIAKSLSTYSKFLSYSEMIDNVKQIITLDPEKFNIIESGNRLNMLDAFYDINTRYMEILQSFPSENRLYTLLEQLDNASKNKQTDLVSNILLSIEGLVNMTDGITTLNDDIKEYKKQLKIINDLNISKTPDNLNTMSIEQLQILNQATTDKIRYLDDKINDENINEDTKEKYTYNKNILLNQINDIQKNIQEKLDEQENNGDVEDQPPNYPPPTSPLSSPPVDQSPPPLQGPSPKSILRDKIEKSNRQIQEKETFINEMKAKIEKSKNKEQLLAAIAIREKRLEELTKTRDELEAELKSMSGNGFTKRRGRPRGCGIVKQKPYSESVKAHVSYDKGIMESPRFVKFGKYLINNHKLNNDDIFALKQPSGGALQEFPSVRLSKQLSNVIKKMVGGGVPSYNDLNGLSEPEKAYLHKVSTRSNIVDKFSIPAPSKDQYEKDIHEFEVLKGEIMAGNDSKELIKKFKLHLMKLSKMGSLPKREVSEVMEELLQMGY
jgi:hypothetical protein